MARESKSTNEIVKAKIASGEFKSLDKPQGVSRERISNILKRLDRFSEALAGTVFALLDDQNGSLYPTASQGAKFCHGASTAHIGAHIAILQGNKAAKLDREGRDVWIKPLVDIGAIELCYLPAQKDKKLLAQGMKFYPGHAKAKSGNNSYRLAKSFIEVLKAPEKDWEGIFADWIKAEALRERLNFQAQASEKVKKLVTSEHQGLIDACCAIYAKRFLSGYKVIYIDDGDGDRIAKKQREELAKVGLELSLVDAMPDVLLWNRDTDELWVIEAVISDGEVDEHKARKLEEFARRHKKTGIGFTTAYPTWKKAAQRQRATHNNLAFGSYFWIMEDASRNFRVEGESSIR